MIQESAVQSHKQSVTHKCTHTPINCIFTARINQQITILFTNSSFPTPPLSSPSKTVSSQLLSGSPQQAANTSTVFFFHSPRGFSHSKLVKLVITSRLSKEGVQYLTRSFFSMSSVCQSWVKTTNTTGREKDSDEST